MRYIRRKNIAVTISTVLLGACGMKMLWQASPSTPAPEIASTLATDAANNSYVGYVTVDDWSNGSMTSRISKLDKNGAILWSIELPAKAIISKIITLTPDVVAVATKSPLDETSTPQVFLMATGDGAMLHELPAASGFESGKSDLMLGNTGEHIYVARSTNACGFLEACDNVGHASLEVFDANGERLHAQSFSTQNIRNIAIDEQGRIAVALSDERLGPIAPGAAWLRGLDTLVVEGGEARRRVERVVFVAAAMPERGQSLEHVPDRLRGRRDGWAQSALAVLRREEHGAATPLREAVLDAVNDVEPDVVARAS